jgi:hypothetical protein
VISWFQAFAFKYNLCGYVKAMMAKMQVVGELMGDTVTAMIEVEEATTSSGGAARWGSAR